MNSCSSDMFDVKERNLLWAPPSLYAGIHDSILHMDTEHGIDILIDWQIVKLWKKQLEEEIGI